MNAIARILIAAVSGLMALPLAATGSEQTTAGPLAPAAQTSAPAVQTGTQPVLRPYYVVPFFPFLLPVPPGHPAAAPVQAQTTQTPSDPSYPFVIWLPALQPAMQTTPTVTPAPAAVKAPVGQPVIEPTLATIQPVPPQAPAAEAEPTPKEGSSPLTVFEAPPQPAVQRGPLPKEPEQAPETPGDTAMAAEPSPESVAVKAVPTKESARPAAAPASQPKPAATRPAAARPAQKANTNKRKLCWKDGKLDVCK